MKVAIKADLGCRVVANASQGVANAVAVLKGLMKCLYLFIAAVKDT